MKKYAIGWESISADEYFSMYRDELFVYSGYSNPGGNDGITVLPQLHTTVGDNEKELLKCIARKKNVLDKDYQYKYFKAIEWVDENEE